MRTRPSRARTRPSHHCPTGVHPEPSRNCYVGHRCRCRRCTEENRKQSKAYLDLHRHLEGKADEGWVDAEPTRVRLRLLWEMTGGKQSELAELCGLSQSGVSLLLYRNISVHRRTARQVLEALEQEMARENLYR